MSRMPRDDGSIVDAVPCPKCDADVGKPCTTAAGRPHFRRVHTARKGAMHDDHPPEKVKDGHNAIAFEGWRAYPNTGRLFRRWWFERSVDAVGARKGFQLHDRGPAREPRFQVRSEDGTQHVDLPTEEAAKIFFHGCLPEWKPPHGADLELRDVIQEFIGAVGKLTRETVRNTSAFEKWTEEAYGKKKSEEGEDDDEVPENQYLRFVRKGRYGNTGHSFTHWELKVDVPAVPIDSSAGVDGKPHAQAGDVLVQTKDRLTPFELERAEVEVASPEWWQVRHLFVGLGAETGGEMPVDPAHSAIVDQVLPHGLRDLRYSNLFSATRAIPGTPIDAGDLVLWIGRSRALHDQEERAIRGTRRRVPRGSFRALLDDLDALEYVTGETSRSRDHLRRYLGHGRTRYGKDETSPLIVLRPLVAPVSEPVEARSDEAAIFELLASVGGRMPVDARIQDRED